jgi:hypothetical protein
MPAATRRWRAVMTNPRDSTCVRAPLSNRAYHVVQLSRPAVLIGVCNAFHRAPGELASGTKRRVGHALTALLTCHQFVTKIARNILNMRDMLSCFGVPKGLCFL